MRPVTVLSALGPGLVALLLAACGGDDPEPGPSPGGAERSSATYAERAEDLGLLVPCEELPEPGAVGIPSGRTTYRSVDVRLVVGVEGVDRECVQYAAAPSGASGLGGRGSLEIRGEDVSGRDMVLTANIAPGGLSTLDVGLDGRTYRGTSQQGCRLEVAALDEPSVAGTIACPVLLPVEEGDAPEPDAATEISVRGSFRASR